MHSRLPHRLLIVSPHLDDAALSCWALIARPEAADVLTVFTGEPDPPQQGHWDRRTGFASSADSVAARRREEERALGGRVRSLRLLDLEELQYLTPPRPQADADRIAAAVAEWRSGGDGLVAIPAGAGWRPPALRRKTARVLRPPGPAPHPDHLFVRDALLAARPVLLYEELPYLWGGRADAEAARLGSPRLLELPIDREEKAAAVAAYASQVPHISPPRRGRIDDPVVLPPVERYWLLD